MVDKTFCFSCFNSERHWRAEDSASFSLLPDEQGDNIVNAMDEMQYAFCLDDDATLLTSIAMNKLHLQYLHSLGFKLKNVFLHMNLRLKQKKHNMAEYILQNPIMLSKLKECNFDKIKNYSILPYTKELSEVILPGYEVPSLEIVKKINSKLYSTELGNKLEDLPGEIVLGSENLFQRGLKMLEVSSLIIKDPFGVSGAGNVLIEKSSALYSIIRFLKKQEQSEKKVEFILEPFYEKDKDFSSLFYINKEGSFDFIGIEIMENKGFSFSKIYPADELFMHFLIQKGYIDKVCKVVEELAQESYWGPVCIDSMLLKNGSIKYIVEINARYSMGFINELIGKKLNGLNSLNSSYMLATINVINKKRSLFEDLLNRLDHNNVLYDTKKGTGIFPVSANTWDVNQIMEYSSYKKRFYYMIFYKEQKELVVLLKTLNDIIDNLDH